MIIEKTTTPFGDLVEGDCFEYLGEAYVKMKKLTEDTGHEQNAVSLLSGAPCLFSVIGGIIAYPNAKVIL